MGRQRVVGPRRGDEAHCECSYTGSNSNEQLDDASTASAPSRLCIRGSGTCWLAGYWFPRASEVQNDRHEPAAFMTSQRHRILRRTSQSYGNCGMPSGHWFSQNSTQGQGRLLKTQRPSCLHRGEGERVWISSGLDRLLRGPGFGARPIHISSATDNVLFRRSS